MTRRSVRTRIVVAVAGPVAAALVLGTVAVTAVFSGGRIRELDAQTLAESRALIAVVDGGDLPAVLPAPVGSTLLGQVVGSDGTVLAATPAASRVQALAGGGHLHPDVRTDEHGTYAGVPLRIRSVAVQYQGRPAYVVVAAPLTDVRRALRALRLVLLLVVPLLLIGVLTVVWWVAGLALRPVEQLRSAAEAQALDPGVTAPLPVPRTGDEVARLATTLNGLLGDLRELVIRQQEFVADAAHELRSPLASMKVQLDVARAHPDQVTVPSLLEDLDADVQRLAGLTDDLLALARAQARTGPRVPVDLRDLADAQGPPVTVMGDPESLRRMVGNLVNNARRYASAVRLTTSYDGNDALLDVDDDGPGIPEADRERVFDRWVRLDEARDRNAGGAGLGLALARTIARAHGGDVTALASPLGGARLRVRLPAATAK